MKITLLVYVEQEGSRDYDKSIDQIAQALRAGGHTPSVYCVHGDLSRLIATLKRRRPALVFNLLEQFGDQELGLVEATGVLDLLGFPYTGGGPGELYLQQDKTLTKKLLAYEGVKCPDFAVFWPEADLETGGNLRMPLFVKPLRLDSSLGIDANRSLVSTVPELLEQVAHIHQKYHDAALCEQYIAGREFYVGVVGNQQPQVFPPIEMDFSGLPEGALHVMDGKAKFDESTPEYRGTRPIVAQLADDLRARIEGVALDAYRALRVRDYGRIDLRLTEAGEIYVIEVNANCYLEQESEYAMAAAATGIEYNELIARIVEAAQERDAASRSQTSGERRRTHRRASGQRVETE
ncbi:MAG: D-alanine--D-alanine ligase family protein [Pirellulaceae bacterium]